MVVALSAHLPNHTLTLDETFLHSDKGPRLRSDVRAVHVARLKYLSLIWKSVWLDGTRATEDSVLALLLAGFVIRDSVSQPVH